MREISRARWDAFTSYGKDTAASLFLKELAWFESDDGRLLAMVAIDGDSEFVAIILARDRRERFRPVHVASSLESLELAILGLQNKITELLPKLDELRGQGDELGRPVDFFAERRLKRRLHPSFQRLSSGDDFFAARNIMVEMMRWYDDVDGNFIEQFQTSGFDARVWELYLFAVLTEAGFKISRPKPAPDLLAIGPRGDFTVEATTINPTQSVGPRQSPIPDSRNEIADYEQHYLPIRYAGPLMSKLRREYWKMPAALARPLVIAIQDFHAPSSMRYSFRALCIYLYGFVHTHRYDSSGRLVIAAIPISEHIWGTKKVPSGFFSQPDSENISAVFFNNAGTINKFNRMGVGAGFGTDRIILVRSGTEWNRDPNSSSPRAFEYVVAEGSTETWIEGLDVFHNPSAIRPFNPDLLPLATHHKMLPDGQIETTSPGRKPMESGTEIRRRK